MRHLILPLWLAAHLLCPAIASAQARPPLTLDEALDLAATRSPAVSAARLEIDASDGARQQAGQRRNPTLNGSVEDLRQANRITTATLDIPLELGGKRAARVVAAEQSTELARAELARTLADVRSDVIQGFFRVLAGQERLRLSRDFAQLARQAADAVGQRVTAGKVSPVDETRARVDEAYAGLETDDAQASLVSDRQALASIWGDPDLAADEVGGDLAALPARPDVAATEAQIEAAPDLVVRRQEIARRRALIGVEKSKRSPDLALSVGARRDNELGLTQAIVGVSIPLQVFDRNQGNLVEAQRRADQAEETYRLARLRLVAALRQASNQLSLARRSAQTLQDTVLPAAQQAYDAARIGYAAGKFAFLDVLDAQRSLLQARTRHVDALATFHQAAASIDRPARPLTGTRTRHRTRP